MIAIGTRSSWDATELGIRHCAAPRKDREIITARSVLLTRPRPRVLYLASCSTVAEMMYVCKTLIMGSFLISHVILLHNA